MSTISLQQGVMSAAPEAGRLEIGGVQIDCVTEDDVIGHILGSLAGGRGGWVVTPNVDVLRQAARDSSIRDLIADADLVIADGMPVVWISRIKGHPLPGRVPGSDLIWSLSEAAGQAGASVFLLGGNSGVAEKAAGVLRDAVPGLQVAGHHCPPMGFESSPPEVEAIFAALEETKPDIVYCGLGFPKQERLIAQLRHRFPATWFLGVGISLSFVCGDMRRAPTWMQERGLEWLHRLSCEPRRLFSRYLVHDLPFTLYLLMHSAGARGGPLRPETA